MNNLAPFLLVVVIITLTFLIALVAVQVFQVLHEARQAVRKFNKLLDNPENLMQVKTEIIDRVVPQEKKVSSSRRFFNRSGNPLRPRN